MYTQLQLRDSTRPPVNVSTLRQMKEKGEKIASLTCYDASYAALVDAAGTDVVLVGDSLGMVIQGHDTTVPVTLENVIYHCRAVSRGLFRPFLMADMPFMTYTSREQALQNAVRLMQEGGAKMVKLEGVGADVVLLECIPAALGTHITQELHVPVIGIGAGPDTDGQILVLYDVLDITAGRKPKFSKNFMDGHGNALEAVKAYGQAVKSRTYPAPEHCF